MGVADGVGASGAVAVAAGVAASGAALAAAAFASSTATPLDDMKCGGGPVLM